jgi:hypothetical protein
VLPDISTSRRWFVLLFANISTFGHPFVLMFPDISTFGWWFVLMFADISTFGHPFVLMFHDIGTLGRWFILMFAVQPTSLPKQQGLQGKNAPILAPCP